ncbi:hypothetical protein [Neobacillus niacini]|uniref:hypothetical protein n=1 Tax=Neobacillus niacini TaxID=86668 RepID=UPI0021CAFDD0|nr:hypothetical protein [Neobacillus niacini]MCM3767367.1 hypothetical protein [Neobacillus niacini]
MKSAAVIFFILCAISFLGAGKYFMDLQRPGVYPPKQVLKKRAGTLAAGGGVCLLIGFLLSFFR